MNVRDGCPDRNRYRDLRFTDSAFEYEPNKVCIDFTEFEYELNKVCMLMYV